MIQFKIDLTKIDKSKLFKSEKTGSIYLDCIGIDTPNNQYDQDFMVVQSTTKEEREAGKKGNFLGNGKNIEKQEPVSAPIEEDDLPF